MNMTPKKIISLESKPSNSKINKAGNIIANNNIDFFSDEYQNAYDIISQRRALHTYPLNTFQANLRKKVDKLWINKDTYIISQRLKRLISIINKLQRFPETQLSRMQDIWWIRVVLPSMKEVTILQDSYLKDNSSKLYTLIRHKDYIENPKHDWYRSSHLIFTYTNNKYPQTEWLQFEFQIRTKIQHARATAVETIWTFIWHSLKSNQWPEEWLEYFRNISVWFSYLEWTTISKEFSSYSPIEIIQNIKEETVRLSVEHKIIWFSIAAKKIKTEIAKTKKWAELFIIILDTKKIELTIWSYTKKEKKQALQDYRIWETESIKNPSLAVVLVSLNQVNDLQKAYPSFFWDNASFLEYVTQLEKTYL